MTSSAKYKNCRRQQKLCLKLPLLCPFSPPKHWQQQDSGEKFNPWGKKKCFPSLPWLHRLVYMHTDSKGKDELSFSKLNPEINWNTFCHWKIIIIWQTMTLFTLRFYHSFRNYIFKGHTEKWANIGYDVDYSVETKVLWLPFVL